MHAPTAAAALAVAASIALPAAAAPYTYVDLASTAPEARTLDGTPYGFAFCGSPTSNATWTIDVQGGGWCWDEADCLARASTALGSSLTWRNETLTHTCSPRATDNRAILFYGDGASFSGYRAAPWPVPGTNATLYFRGIANLDATVGRLLALGMRHATRIVFTGGSAGGLTTWLHVDRVAQRMAVDAPAARVVGQVRTGQSFGVHCTCDAGQPSERLTHSST